MVDSVAVFETAIEKGLNMTYYAEIMNTFNLVDVSTDADFQRTYTYFYRVRRGQKWRRVYFGYFERAKTLRPTFKDALYYIYENTGNIEPSFTSKMMATLDPSMPIWDSVVFKHLGLQLEGSSKDEQLENAVALYDRLCAWYQEFLQTDEARESIAAFDAALPHYRWLSDTKKIDFLLWGDRD